MLLIRASEKFAASLPLSSRGGEKAFGDICSLYFFFIVSHYITQANWLLNLLLYLNEGLVWLLGPDSHNMAPQGQQDVSQDNTRNWLTLKNKENKNKHSFSSFLVCIFFGLFCSIYALFNTAFLLLFRQMIS